MHVKLDLTDGIDPGQKLFKSEDYGGFSILLSTQAGFGIVPRTHWIGQRTINESWTTGKVFKYSSKFAP